MNRSIVRMMRGVGLAGTMALPMVAGAQSTPIIAVWPYQNNSFGPKAADFKGVETGVGDLLITDIAASRKVRVVDRANLSKILEEHNLSKSGDVDPATAVTAGKLMGACYVITGGFIDSGNGMITITARMISMETGQVDPNTVKISKKSDDVMELIDEMSTKIQAQLRLTGCPTGAPRSASAPPPPTVRGGQMSPPATVSPAMPAEVKYANAMSADQAKAFVTTKLDMKNALLYSKGLDAMDNKDPKKAAQLFTQVLAAVPGFEPAQANLKKANSTGH